MADGESREEAEKYCREAVSGEHKQQQIPASDASGSDSLGIVSREATPRAQVVLVISEKIF